jgi:hypothetical protein
MGGTRGRLGRVPWGLMPEHGVEDDKKLAHATYEGDLRFLARRKQSRIKGPRQRISTSCDQRTHIKHRANLSATAPNRSCTTELAAVVIERRDSNQGRDLSSTKRAEFRQMGQKSDYCDAAYRGHAAEHPGFFGPQRRVNRLLQSNIELGQLFAQPTDVRGNSALDVPDRSSVPVTLGGHHFDHLSATRDRGEDGGSAHA